MITGSFTRKALVALALVASPCMPAIQAEDIVQIASIPNTANWNNPAYWGNGVDPIIPGNNYFAVPIPGSNLETQFVIDGTTWASQGFMRDASSNPNMKAENAAFDGGSLHLTANSAFLSKVENGASSTANIVFDGGFIRHAGDSSATGSVANLHGSIAFGTSNIGAIGSHNGGAFVLNIHSTILGGVGDTLQLTTTTLGSSRINLFSDLGGFFGTIYAGGSQTGTWTTQTSTFSIASDATHATIHLDTLSNGFRYELFDNVTFGALTLGGGLVVEPGTYTFEDLNDLSGTAFFSGGGTITVVPEPSILAMAILGFGLLVMRIAPRHRRIVS